MYKLVCYQVSIIPASTMKACIFILILGFVASTVCHPHGTPPPKGTTMAGGTPPPPPPLRYAMGGGTQPPMGTTMAGGTPPPPPTIQPGDTPPPSLPPMGPPMPGPMPPMKSMKRIQS